ncbi:MAG: helix-turn-helix domain-containing protein [Bacteroidales bacterium]|nr:helix-turn-helix domain-containing protein [Bacteroidales bacterium]
MQNQIKRYKVQNPVLKNYIKFFWELCIDHTKINHKLLPQRNINIRFNLSDTPHRVFQNNQTSTLEDVYFCGLQNKFTNAYLRFEGKINVIGICFYPDGLFPFLKIPLSEFRNQILGANEIGFKRAEKIISRLRQTNNTFERLMILENELMSLLDNSFLLPNDFRFIFKSINQVYSLPIIEHCKQNNTSLRQLERKYNKYVGVPANTYRTLNRFHKSLNQLISSEYSKLADLAYINEYFDQMHFIKDFKRFTGETPKKFIDKKNSILEIGKLT